jgi:hypothetical protein
MVAGRDGEGTAPLLYRDSKNYSTSASRKSAAVYMRTRVYARVVTVKNSSRVAVSLAGWSRSL